MCWNINYGIYKSKFVENALTSNTEVLAWHASHLAKLFQFGNINESLQTNVTNNYDKVNEIHKTRFYSSVGVNC